MFTTDPVHGTSHVQRIIGQMINNLGVYILVKYYCHIYVERKRHKSHLSTNHAALVIL